MELSLTKGFRKKNNIYIEITREEKRHYAS